MSEPDTRTDRQKRIDARHPFRWLPLLDIAHVVKQSPEAVFQSLRAYGAPRTDADVIFFRWSAVYEWAVETQLNPIASRGYIEAQAEHVPEHARGNWDEAMRIATTRVAKSQASDLVEAVQDIQG